MKKIKLTQNQYTLVDNKDYLWITRHKWYISSTGYAIRTIYLGGGRANQICKTIRLHREILGVRDGEVDHANRDKLDNRRSNLRIASHQFNSANRSKPKNNTSGYKGVYWDKKKKRWKAQIKVNQKKVYIGRFKDPIEAAKAYNRMAVKYFREFAFINQ